jgi:hypothetical protein
MLSTAGDGEEGTIHQSCPKGLLMLIVTAVIAARIDEHMGGFLCVDLALSRVCG